METKLKDNKIQYSSVLAQLKDIESYFGSNLTIYGLPEFRKDYDVNEFESIPNRANFSGSVSSVDILDKYIEALNDTGFFSKIVVFEYIEEAGCFKLAAFLKETLIVSRTQC